MREGWNKGKKQTSETVDDADDDDNGIVNEYAGVVGDDESDKVEREAARNKKVKCIDDAKVQSMPFMSMIATDLHSSSKSSQIQ